MPKNLDRMTADELEQAIQEIGQQQEALREQKLALARRLDTLLLDERAAQLAANLTPAEIDALTRHATARANALSVAATPKETSV